MRSPTRSRATTSSDLRDELGDLLLQVVYHARMGEEIGAFAFPDVVEAITRKLIRRHPHVFGDAEARAAGAAKGIWEKIKAEEKRERAAARPAEAKPHGLLDSVPAGLPAMIRAVRLQEKASTVGFDWNDPRAVLDKLREEIAEIEAELAAPDRVRRASRGRSRRPALRRRQSRAPPEDRSRPGAAANQCEVHAAVRAHRSRAQSGKPEPGGSNARRDGSVVAGGEGGVRRAAVSAAILLRGAPAAPEMAGETPALHHTSPRLAVGNARLNRSATSFGTRTLVTIEPSGLSVRERTSPNS